MTGNSTNWFFESAAGKTIKARNLIPISQAGKIKTVDKDEVINKVNTWTKRDSSKFTDIELGTRIKYKRAYEFWKTEEENLLLEVVKEITDPFMLSELFQRQPSAIQDRLKEKFNILI